MYSSKQFKLKFIKNAFIYNLINHIKFSIQEFQDWEQDVTYMYNYNLYQFTVKYSKAD